MTTWTPATSQAETWTSEDPAPRVFSPYVFSLYPTFDTGHSTAGIWAPKTQQAETWTVEP